MRAVALLMLAWAALAFLAVGIAYLTSSPGLLGKRRDGTFRPAHLLVLLPFFALVRMRTWLTRRLSSEAAWHEVVPGLFLGRWPASDPVPAAVRIVVDLSAELPRAAGLRAVPEYISVPTLDHTSPPVAMVVSVAERMSDPAVPAFVHCAFGHGRSALMVGAILLRRKVVRSVSEAVSLMRAARPRVELNRSQLAQLRELEAQLLGQL